MSVPSDRNTWTKVIEKISKNEDLEIEITKMWVLEIETVSTLHTYTFLSVPKDQGMGPVLILILLILLNNNNNNNNNNN